MSLRHVGVLSDHDFLGFFVLDFTYIFVFTCVFVFFLIEVISQVPSHHLLNMSIIIMPR